MPFGSSGRSVEPLSRRRFAALLAALAAVPARAREAERALDFRILPEGFGGASEPDIRAVLRSAAAAIWQHCPDTRLPAAGLQIYHHDKFPITHFDLSPEGRVVVGLCVTGLYWAQFAFQFAHEFAHALMDHANDRDRIRREFGHANRWLEECLCETASLFSLRAMGRTWETEPPYPNWRSFAPHLRTYAQDRLDDPKHRAPEGRTFAAWFAAEEPSLRKDATQRDKNAVVARELLPLFESDPRGWETLPYLKLGAADKDQPLAPHLAAWRARLPPPRQPFAAKLAAVFSLPVSASPASP